MVPVSLVGMVVADGGVDDVHVVGDMAHMSLFQILGCIVVVASFAVAVVVERGP